MRANPIQFATVREDPTVEIQVARAIGARAFALVASGGCTAFALQREVPDARFTLFDLNPHQLALVEKKRQALATLQGEALWEAFGVGRDDPHSLNGCGNFESLFRGLRAVLHDLVESPDRWQRALTVGDPDFVAEIVNLPYWSIAFRQFFSAPFIEAMFSTAATRHAEPDSYGPYFQAAIERGLAAENAHLNPWLHLALLGAWQPHALPKWFQSPAPEHRFQFVHGGLDALSLSDVDLLGLSNIFDWMDEEHIRANGERLAGNLKAGAHLIVRQLNNEKDIPGMFGDAFEFSLFPMEQERSLFYRRTLIGRKR